jgi:hypothetical protein
VTYHVHASYVPVYNTFHLVKIITKSCHGFVFVFCVQYIITDSYIYNVSTTRIKWYIIKYITPGTNIQEFFGFYFLFYFYFFDTRVLSTYDDRTHVSECRRSTVWITTRVIRFLYTFIRLYTYLYSLQRVVPYGYFVIYFFYFDLPSENSGTRRKKKAHFSERVERYVSATTQC